MLTNKKRTGTCAAITERNQRRSPLLRLPGEIRNQIYGYVMNEGAYTFVSTGGISTALQIQDPHRLALLKSCRQIYEETAELPFMLNAFGFDSLQTFYLLSNKLDRNQRFRIKKLHLMVNIRSSHEVPVFLAQMKQLRVKFATLYRHVKHVRVDMPATHYARYRYRLGIMGRPFSKAALSRKQRVAKWLLAHKEAKVELRMSAYH